uniref:Ribonuclease P protein subunit p14 n=1 Tax=Bos indicus x Bos taurus TaxID=30522 RepID=A0A4W2EUK2_BOBOX
MPASAYHYMKVRLEFQDCGIGLNAAQFKQLLISALKDLFGEVDAALPLDVLTYEEKTLSAILRICSSGLVKLWSSLTLLGSYKGKNCAFRVIQVSPLLLALSGNSRELELSSLQFEKIFLTLKSTFWCQNAQILNYVFKDASSAISVFSIKSLWGKQGLLFFPRMGSQTYTGGGEQVKSCSSVHLCFTQD